MAHCLNAGRAYVLIPRPAAPRLRATVADGLPLASRLIAPGRQI